MALAIPDKRSHTTLLTHPFSMEWTISPFSALIDGGVHHRSGELSEEFLESEIFTAPTGHKWRLSMSPTWNQTCLGVFLSFCGMEDGTSEAIKTLYKIRILDENDREFVSSAFKTDHESTLFEFGPHHGISGYNAFTRLEELTGPVGTKKGLLKNDTLRIYCSLKVEGKLTRTGRDLIGERRMEGTVGSGNLVGDLQTLFSGADGDPFADVTLKVGTSSFRCHKVMLAARSEVFRTMFSTKMSESETGQVTMEGVSVEVVQEMLQYIYTGSVSTWKKTASDLFALGHRYSILGLKLAAEMHLISNLTVKNAAKYFRLGSIFHAILLMEMAQEFICRNKRDVVKTDGFLRLMEEEPKLVADLFVAEATTEK